MFFEAADLEVSLVNTTTGVETAQVLTTDYSVTGGSVGEGPLSGSISMGTAPPTGTTLVIQRAIEFTQEIDYQQNDGFPAETNEEGLDRNTMLTQQANQRARQSPKLPATFDPSGDPITVELPVAQSLLIGNAGATGWENITLASLASGIAANLPDVALPGRIVVQGTADAATDTAALTAAITAASGTGLVIELYGTFVLRIPETVSFEYALHDVHVCVPLASNVHVRGGKIMVEEPQFAMTSTSRVFLFGTPVHTTAQGQMERITFEDTVFDFAATYGAVPNFTYAFGLVGVDYFKRANITMLTSSGSTKGRGLWAQNCRYRTSTRMVYDTIQQAYFTAYDYYSTETDIYADGVWEFYDGDGYIKGMQASNIRVKNLTTGDELFDIASIQDSVISGIDCENVGNIAYMYVKQQSAWPTYAEYWKHTAGAAYPVVTINIGTGVITWPGDYDLVADGKVTFETTGALPTGLTTTAMYYIVGSSITGFSAQVAATPGGAAIGLSGTQSGVHQAKRFPYTPEGCKNVTIENVRGYNLRSNGASSTVAVSTARTTFERDNTPVQCEDITFRDWKLYGGNKFYILEGTGIVIDDVLLDGFEPGTGAETGAAFIAIQSLASASRIILSQLEIDIRNLRIKDSEGMGALILSATVLRGRNITVDGYNLQGNANTAYGVYLGDLGRKSGRVDVDGINVVTTITNCTDLYIDERATPEEYILRVGEDLRLRTTASGFVNVRCDTSAMCDNRTTLNLPTYNTAASAVWDDTVLQSSKAYHRILGASVINHDAIAGDAVNNSRLRFFRSVAGVHNGIANLTFPIDEAAKVADLENYQSGDPTDADTLIAPGEALITSVSARAGTGSTTPKLQVRVAAIKYFKN